MDHARILTLVLAAAVVSGCAVGPRNMTPTSSLLEPQVAQKFSDVPVPAGFKMVAKESFSFENAGVRVAVLKYQGTAFPDQVITFYKDQMPMYNWNLLNVIEYGEHLLNFDRDNESCIITFTADGRNILLRINVGPKATGSKREKTRLK
jgi:hypothetical protein